MDKKMIFLDIDGTLTLPGTSVPFGNSLKAVKEAQANGHKVFLCSGRNVGMLQALMAYGFDGAVASAGGHVVCGDKVLYDDPMPWETLDRTRAILDAAGVCYIMESKYYAFGSEETMKLMLSSKSTGSEAERWRRIIREELGIHPIQEYQGEGVYKLSFITAYPEQFPTEELSKDFTVCSQNAFGGDGLFRGELINRAFDKGIGMKRVCDHFGASMRDTVAFGDSMNDFAMLKAAGTSVCMENGDRELKEISNLVCPAVGEDGLYQGFVRLGLI